MCRRTILQFPFRLYRSTQSFFPNRIIIEKSEVDFFNYHPRLLSVCVCSLLENDSSKICLREESSIKERVKSASFIHSYFDIQKKTPFVRKNRQIDRVWFAIVIQDEKSLIRYVSTCVTVRHRYWANYLVCWFFFLQTRESERKSHVNLCFSSSFILVWTWVLAYFEVFSRKKIHHKSRKFRNR